MFQAQGSTSDSCQEKAFFFIFLGFKMPQEANWKKKIVINVVLCRSSCPPLVYKYHSLPDTAVAPGQANEASIPSPTQRLNLTW